VLPRCYEIAPAAPIPLTAPAENRLTGDCRLVAARVPEPGYDSAATGGRGGMTEEPTEHGPDRRHELDVLTRIVHEELAAAGLPVVPRERPVGVAGALVSVDLPDLRGVLVEWRPHALLVDGAQEAWGDDPHREGAETPEFSRLLSRIGTAMSEAKQKILPAAGLEVTGSGNEPAPAELLVTRRLAPSAWQARRDARARSRHESMRAAWNARRSADDS